MRRSILTMSAAVILACGATGAASAQGMRGAVNQPDASGAYNQVPAARDQSAPVQSNPSMSDQSATGRAMTAEDCSANPKAKGCKGGYYTNSSSGYYDDNGKWHSAPTHKEKGWYDSKGVWHSGSKTRDHNSPGSYYNDQPNGFSDANGHWHPTDAPVDIAPH